MSKQPAIEIKNLSKKYRIDHYGKNKQNTIWDMVRSTLKKPSSLVTGDRAKHEAFWALKDITFKVEKGDVVGIIGRNGSGKSTLLKILSQIVEPTTGEVHMKGRVASLLEVGTGFHPELTGRENIFFNGSILGMSRKEINAKFNDIVEFSEIERFLDTPVKFYSSGMYVKLAFSVAAHLDPDILIVDEVLAVGDVAFQKKCLGKMKDVAGQGRTVLFVSHSIGTIQKICNKGAVLQSGELIYLGDIGEATKRYIESYSSVAGSDEFSNQIVAEAPAVASVDKAQIINSTNASTTRLAFGEQFSVSAEIEVEHDADDLVFAVGIKNAQDIPITTIWAEPKSYKSGRYQLKIDVDEMILETGIYNVIFGLSQNEKTFFYNDTALGFVIEGATNNKRIQSTHGAGIVLTPLPIKVNKIIDTKE